MSDLVELKRDLGGAVIDFTLFIAGMALRGIVLSYLWLWFVVPLGVTPIGIFQGLGISTIVTFLTFQPHIKHELHTKGWRTVVTFLWPILAFIFGYLYHFGV